MFGRPAAGGSGGSELERLRTRVARHFTVYETRVGPQSLLLAVHLDTATLEGSFDALRRELGPLGYIPVLRREHGEDFVEVLRRPPFGPRRAWINLVLLGATIATTTFAGSMIWLAWVGDTGLAVSDVVNGFVFFAGPLLAILGVHETAHYVVARRRHLDASLPYFIPIPPPYLLGTFGAFVSMREPFPDRKSLFDVGAAGPIAGFLLSVPIALGGLALSAHVPAVPATYCGATLLGQDYGNLLLGPSLLWSAFGLFFPASFVHHHPLALAGWVGILVTAINLIPAGTLDGGHIFRALLGERARYVSYAAALALFGLGLVYVGWVIFGILVLLLGLRHPPPLNDRTPLDRPRYAAGVFVAAILVGGFAALPFSTPQGDVGVTDAASVAWHVPPAGMAVASNLTLTVRNQDPVAHAYFFDVVVTNVSVRSGNTTTYLSGAALAAWTHNASWRFFLPGNVSVGNFSGAAAALPPDQAFTVGGNAAVVVEVALASPASAVGAVVVFHAAQICPPTGGGSAYANVDVRF